MRKFQSFETSKGNLITKEQFQDWVNKLTLSSIEKRAIMQQVELREDKLHCRNVQIADLKQQIEQLNKTLYEYTKALSKRTLFIQSFLDWVAGFQFEGWYPRNLVKEGKEIINA